MDTAAEDSSYGGLRLNTIYCMKMLICKQVYKKYLKYTAKKKKL